VTAIAAPLIGRDPELAALLTAAARVPAAGLVAVVVSGEAGIGKSHLLAAATAELGGKGWRVVPVQADRLERQVPYAALATALRTLTTDNNFTADLRRDALSALDLPGVDAVAAPGAAFGRACAVMTRMLTALAAAGPVAVVVDDLHELDDDSLALLAVVLRRLAAAPVALVAALRPHLAAPNAAAEELLERLAERVEVAQVRLRTLAPADLASVITPILGARPDGDLTGEVHRRADGNPYFAAEIARSLAESGLVTVDGDGAHLAVAPDVVRLSRRGAVLRRVLPLAPDTLAVARTLAVLRSVGLERLGLVAEVAALPEPAVAAAFDDLVRANAVIRDAARGYRFAHDIVADALYDEIGPAESRRLHRLVAERLLAARTRGDTVDLLQLAWHVSESAGPGDHVAVGVLTEAALTALSSAPEAAAGLCARALALLGEPAPGPAGPAPGPVPSGPWSEATREGGTAKAPGPARAERARANTAPGPVPSGPRSEATREGGTAKAPGPARAERAQASTERAPASTERARLLALRCRALARASRPAAAVPAGRAALALLPPGDERSRTAVAVLGCLFWLGRVDEAIEVVDEQLATGPGPAALHAQRALLLVFANRTAEGVAEAAVAAARPTGSPAEDVVVQCQLCMLSSMLFRQQETVEHADRALHRAGDSTTLRLQALAVGASTSALAGLVPDAARRLQQAEQQIRDEPGTAALFSGELGLTRIVLDWLAGRWDAALEGVRTLAAELETREQATLVAALTAIELELRTWRGELVLAAPLAERPAPAMRNMAALHALALSGYRAARGDVDGARAVLTAAVGDPVTTSYSCLLLARLIELEVGCGHPDAARAALATLVEVAAPRVSPWSVTTLHRMTGLVEGSKEALVRAAAEAESGGLVFERARAQLALGELDAAAVTELVDAYQTFARLGAHGLRRRAGKRLHELGAKVPRARSRAAGLLTESEERVARLVQQGMRNREIAAALHYSPRSIEVYLSRIYAKLRVSSRLELARALDAMDARP